MDTYWQIVQWAGVAMAVLGLGSIGAWVRWGK